MFTRHANITITSLPHATSQDVILDGYRIPSDAIILADLDSVNSDQAKWKDPEVFRPQRFIHKDGSLLSVEEFTPFFLGNVMSKWAQLMEFWYFGPSNARNQMGGRGSKKRKGSIAILVRIPWNITKLPNI